jgi:hypothetical protein
MVVKKKVDSVEHHTEKVEKEEVAEVQKVRGDGYVTKVRANPWIASTIVLGIVVILILALGNVWGGGKATTVSADEAGANVLNFLKSNPAITGEVTLVSTKLDGQFYQVMLSYQGQEVPVYTTLDGKFLIGNPVSLTEQQTAQTDQPGEETGGEVQADTTVPKSDKPKVEVFVMSHCPFGTQIEKGILSVATLLGDKIEFEIKFVNYAMHGEKEVLEQLNQYCIETEQNAKYLDYLQCFLEEGDGEGCLTEAKIDKNKLKTCTTKADKDFEIMANFNDQSKWLNGRFPQFNTHQAENEEYGVRGSPTLVVNGKQANSGRDPASLLATICNAFNTAPEECNTELSSASPSPGFGWSTTTADSAAAAQCG